jgi:hypothetical protein
LPGLASNHDPPDLCLLSSWDYRHEPPTDQLEFTNFNGSVSMFPRKHMEGELHLKEACWKGHSQSTQDWAERKEAGGSREALGDPIWSSREG